jgi:tetratricopeptide (TPR) repeat protein
MLDVALINLTAAGLGMLCRPRKNEAVPPQAAGEQMVRALLVAAPGPTQTLINRCVEDIWQACQAVGLPAELADPHLSVLPDLIENVDLSAPERAIFETGPSDDNSTDQVLSDLADRICALAESEENHPSDIDQTVLTYLLGTFFKSLAASHGILGELRPFATDILAPPAEQTSSEAAPEVAPSSSVPQPAAPSEAAPSQAAATLAKIERAEALGVSVPILEVITVSLINRNKSAALRHDDLVSAAASARNLGEALEQLEHRPSAQLSSIRDANNQFLAGRIVECDRILAGAEDHAVRHSIENSPPDAALAEFAVEIRKIRAGLSALQGNYLKAARHHGFAQRYIPRTSHEARWRSAEQEAHYYELAAYHQATADALEHATRACSGALAAMPDHTGSPTYAIAQTTLARLLIILGEKEQAPGRFELAAQLLVGAQSIFEAALETPGDETTQEVSIANIHATVLRAIALTRLGELHRTPDLLEQAAMYIQAAMTGVANLGIDLSNPSQEIAVPADITVGLETQLALTIAAFADINAQAELHNTAIVTILEALPQIVPDQTQFAVSDYAHCILAARCHRALATWHSAIGDLEAEAKHLAQASKAYAAAGFVEVANRLAKSSQVHTADTPNKQIDSEADAA